MNDRARGLWFDETKKKWRVRLYRNGKSYVPQPCAYFDTELEAREAYEALRAAISEIPKKRRTPNTEVDLMSVWRQCTGAAAHLRIQITIDAERV
jgi:hypothetical protein